MRFLRVRHFSATRSARPRKQPIQDDFTGQEPPLPRYLRRQLVFAQTTSPTKQTSNDAKVFRSKHFDPSKANTPKEAMMLLEPHVLSARLKKLCNANQIDAAVSMLKNAPLDAQNVPVWNTLIWEAMKARRFKLGYELYIDMKRRGHSPTTRTFQTIFSGLSRIENWSAHTKQLANSRSLYDAYQKHMMAIKKVDPTSPHLCVDPLSAYIKILGDAGHYQDIFDVYYAMDAEGPLAPNQLIFTAIFRALSSKAEAGCDRVVPYLKNAADAKLLWKQMLKLSHKHSDFQVDSFIAAAAISALTRGGASEQSLAFEIVRDYFGLCKPEDTAPTNFLPLSAPSLDAVLRLCNCALKYDLCLDFVQQVKRRADDMGGPSIIDRGHMEEVLKAHLALSNGNTKYGGGDKALNTLEWMLRQEILGKNGPNIRPTHSTFNLVMTACWRTSDWQSAMRTFELMTGYHAHDFIDGAVAQVPRLDKRTSGRHILLTPEIASTMVRAALASGNRANMRQCLRIISFLDLDKIIGCNADGVESHKATKNRAFYRSKLISVVLEIVERAKGDRDSTEEVRKWDELGSRATQLGSTLHNDGKSNFIPTEKVRHNKAAEKA
ncbi:hypothetical protein APHAL10511_001849 [Amanita phalloides]|nr:hypothetical protein APHAL10511_001849 [Amanita phalloides]